MYTETEDVAFLAVKINFLLGLRVGELAALKWEDCKDLSHLHIVHEEVRNQETNQHEIIEHTKTNRDGFVILIPKARKVYFYEGWGAHYIQTDCLCIGEVCRETQNA